MMLRKVIAEETGFVGRFQKLEPLLIELVQRRGTAVNPIEQAKFSLGHVVVPPVLSPNADLVAQGTSAQPMVFVFGLSNPGCCRVPTR
jgi:hypothetical protein